MPPTGKHFRKREAILSYMQGTTAHPSAEMVYSQLKQDIPDLSLGTVYRNLSMFKQQGAIASVAVVGGVERFDGDTSPHVHFICNDCCSVMDLEGVAVPQALSQGAEAETGGRVDTCQLSFTGLCSKCLKKFEKGGESA